MLTGPNIYRRRKITLLASFALFEPLRRLKKCSQSPRPDTYRVTALLRVGADPSLTWSELRRAGVAAAPAHGTPGYPSTAFG